MKNWLALLAVLVALPAVSPAQATTYDSYGVAVLQGTDKVTGHVEKITVPVGGDTRFGNLYVGVRACRKTPAEELPESVAFIMVSEVSSEPFTPKFNQAATPVIAKTWFSGWMFASVPSLAALEHPVYDVAVVDCQQPLNTDADQPAVPVVPAVPSAPTNAATKAALPATVPSRSSAN